MFLGFWQMLGKSLPCRRGNSCRGFPTRWAIFAWLRGCVGVWGALCGWRVRQKARQRFSKRLPPRPKNVVVCPTSVLNVALSLQRLQCISTGWPATEWKCCKCRCWAAACWTMWGSVAVYLKSYSQFCCRGAHVNSTTQLVRKCVVDPQATNLNEIRFVAHRSPAEMSILQTLGGC